MTLFDYYLLWAGTGLLGCVIGFYIDYYLGNDSRLKDLLGFITLALTIGPFVAVMAISYFCSEFKIFDKVVIKGRNKNED
jgi:hypothetical protein